MAAIATPLVQRKKDPDEEQLLKLFWNRAELKKELAKLRRDQEKLVEQLRQQEGINLRAQQQLEQLENMLADPLQAANALVYYQLRGVWQQCRKRLKRLGRELVDRQQDREEQAARSRFEQRRDADIGAIDEKIAEHDGRRHRIEGELRAVNDRMTQLRGFWNYFRRRAIGEQAAAIQATLDGVNTQDERLQSARREKESEPCPAFEGLTTEGKRNINLAIVAMAQQLLVQLTEHDVAAQAREAAVRSFTDVSYGAVAECRALSQHVEAVARRVDAGDKLNAQVRRRAEMLRATAQYRRDTDTVPVASSFAVVPLLVTDAGAPKAADGRSIAVNVLAEEYWDIYSVLLS